ncbi:MAG: hypothetical protein Q8Q23_06245 [bacterium]|nr:hypothetical protein [bacterium]
MPKKITAKKVEVKKTRRKAKASEKQPSKAEQLKKADYSRLSALDQQMKSQREKYIALWSGVIFFMGLIFLVWVLNFQQIFQQINQSALSNESNGELKEILNDLSATFNEAKQGIDELNENISEAQVEGIVIDKLTAEKKAVIDERIKLDKFIADLNTNIKYSQFKEN